MKSISTQDTSTSEVTILARVLGNGSSQLSAPVARYLQGASQPLLGGRKNRYFLSNSWMLHW